MSKKISELTALVGALDGSERLEISTDESDPVTRSVTSQQIADLAGGGGGGTPGGSDKQVQFNDSSAFGAEAGFEYDKTTNTLTVVRIRTSASDATDGSGFRMPHGAAPTSPTNGDIWTTSAGIFVRINGATVGPLSAGGGGGLTYLTEALATASPNDTKNAVSLSVTGGTTDADLVIHPKGNGAILAQVPDADQPAGNKRGSSAVDLQMGRSNADEVASGNFSTTFGEANKASGGRSVAMGSGSYATADYAVAIGEGNRSTAIRAVTLGSQCNGTGQYSVAMGRRCTADGDYSMATGRSSNALGVLGARAHASGLMSSAGDVQFRDVHVFAQTTDDTPTSLSAGGTGAGSTTQLNVPSGSCVTFHTLVSAKRQGANENKGWMITGMAKNISGTTSLVGSPTVTVIGADGAAAAWTVDAVADNTNDCVAITVTGESGKTIAWSAVSRSSEVTF
jgi:hypothetical protein